MAFNAKKTGAEADDMIRKLGSIGAEDGVSTPANEPTLAPVQDGADAGAEGVDNTATPATPAEPTPAEGETVNTDAGADATPTPATEHGQVDDLAEIKDELRTANERWKTLQGMIDKKDAELESLRRLLAQLHAEGSRKESENTDQGVAGKVQEPGQLAISDRELKEFGQDMIDLVTRIARHEAQTELHTFSQSLDSVLGDIQGEVKTVGQTTGKVAEERFLSDLARLVPDWETVNYDEGFLQWLNEVDRFTGMKRLDLLRQAFSSMDSRRTAEFFNAYKVSIAPPADPATPAAPAPEVPSKRDPSALVSPGQSRASSPKPAEPQAKVWTRGDITKFYEDKFHKRITAEEADRLERDLFKAQREGRVELA